MRTLSLAAMLLAIAVPGLARAAPAILGVQVGAPLTLPKCDFAKDGFVHPENCWAGEEATGVLDEFLSNDARPTPCSSGTLAL